MSLIFVEVLWETSLVFNIALSEVVGALKAQIQAITGTPIAHQRLQHIDDDMCKLRFPNDSSEFQNEKTLESYGISEGTTLFLSFSCVIFVRTLTGEKQMFHLAPGVEVLTLKHAIWERERISADNQRLIFSGRQLEDGRTLSAYGITEESTIQLLSRLRGGGEAHEAKALAYATVYHDWDGDMSSSIRGLKRTRGLKLIRGNTVVIDAMLDRNWYLGRVPGEILDGSRFFPSSYVKVERFLDLKFQAAAPGRFHGNGSKPSELEKADAESVVTNFQPDESRPTPPLPPFKITADAPSYYFKCKIADKGSSFVSVTFIPDDWRLAIPGDPVCVTVKLLCLTHDPRLRIVSVSLRVIVPDNQVRSVEPQKLLIGEGVVSVHRTDRANMDVAAELGVGIKFGTVRGEARRTKETIIERSGEEAISCDIRGDVDENTAVWSIKANGAHGIRGNVDELSFSLTTPPGEILYFCSVSAMMDGENTPITRYVTSEARRRSPFSGFASGKKWFSFLRQFT